MDGNTVADVASDAAGDTIAIDAPLDAAWDATPMDVIAMDAPLDASVPDAVVDARAESSIDAPVDATCDAQRTFYRDKDGDGFGATDDHVLACVPPTSGDGGSWVAKPGDCRDDLPQVKPYEADSVDPPKFSGTGYADPTKPQGTSFDFDCNGMEQPDPSNAFGAAAICPSSSLNCKGTGYVTAAPARIGTGINSYCGSTTLKSCVVQGLNCVAQYVVTTPFRCR